MARPKLEIPSCDEHEVYKLRLTGVTPYLHNSSDPDRTLPEYEEYQKLQQMRGRTVDQNERLIYLDWRLGLHWSEEVGPFVPADQVLGCLAAAGGRLKIKSAIKRSVVVSPFEIPLLYDGPRDIEGLWEQDYQFSTMVATAGISRGRITRTRACFDDWAIECELVVDPEEVDIGKLGHALRRASEYGVGDGRTIGRGRFVSEIEFLRLEDLTTVLQRSSSVSAKRVHQIQDSRARKTARKAA